MLEAKGYALIKNLCSTCAPASMSVTNMAALMKSHLQPAPNLIMERYKFKECRQTVDEEIKSYVTRLKEAATYCEFGTNLENHLRDQLVWGISSEGTKKKLLGEKDLTYQRQLR